MKSLEKTKPTAKSEKLKFYTIKKLRWTNTKPTTFANNAISYNYSITRPDYRQRMFLLTCFLDEHNIKDYKFPTMEKAKKFAEKHWQNEIKIALKLVRMWGYKPAPGLEKTING